MCLKKLHGCEKLKLLFIAIANDSLLESKSECEDSAT